MLKHERLKFGTKCIVRICVILLFLNVDIECRRGGWGKSKISFNLFNWSRPKSSPSHHTGRSHSGIGSGSSPSGIAFTSSNTHGHTGKTFSTSGGTSLGKPPPYGIKNPSAPSLPPGAPYPIRPPPYTPHNPGIPPPAYNPDHNPAGYGPPPAYSPSHNAGGNAHPPANSPGYGHGSYPQQPYHSGGYSYPYHHHTGSSGTRNVNNNTNTNIHNYGGGYGGFGGHYGGNSNPSYHYSSGDVGGGTLGSFLGYSLAKVTTPTYHSHPEFYDGYTPKYDHYEVHHYYHNRESIPAQTTIQPDTIVGCIGDSGTICPSGTISLCTSNGAILCVANVNNTVPCTDQKQGNCVTTVIPCVNSTGDCVSVQTIPCISKAEIPGSITYVNNTIIVKNTTIVNNNEGNSTAGNATIINTDSTTISSFDIFENNEELWRNLTALEITLNTMIKREIPAVPINEFCVTILAFPAERKPTQQEQIFHKGTNIFSKFMVRAFGM